MAQTGESPQGTTNITTNNTNTTNSNSTGNTTGERFPCCVTVEDISVSLTAAATPSIVTSYWDEIRVVMRRDGVTQCTRWLSPSMAFHHVCNTTTTTAGNSVNTIPSEKGDGITSEPQSLLSQSQPTLDVQWSSINTVGFNVHFRYLLGQSVDHSLDPGYQRAVYSSNIKYLDAYNTDTADRVRPKVSPKTIHPFIFTVECRKKEKVLDPARAQDGEQRPTSASMEAFAAYYAKSKSKMSAFLKKVSAKLSVDSTHEKDGVEKKNSGERPQKQDHYETSEVPFAVYVCTSTSNSNSNSTSSGIDPSEAYNALGGQKRFSLPLHSTSSHIPSDAKCVPVMLHFTMRAHLKESSPLTTIPLRNYHDMVILVDQVLIDVMNAKGSRVTKNDLVPKIVESYAFGFTSNTAYTNELSFRSPFLKPPPIRVGEDGGVRPVDFSLLHPSQDEHLLTALDIAKNPTSICIVSSECKNGNKKRIGNRAVSISRFKTARDGLCKPSYKSQLVMALIRRFTTGEVEVEKCANPIDLASIINQEYYFDGVRQLEFSLGEYMSFRIRRRCFKDAERYRSELLMPFDYDNSGVNCDDLDKDESSVLFNSEQFSKGLVAEATSSQQDQEDEQQQQQQESNQNNQMKFKDPIGFDVPNVISADSGFEKITTTNNTTTTLGSLKKEKEVPSVQRLTDDVLTSYNNYEDQSYQPSEKTNLETNHDREEQRKRLNLYNEKSKSDEVNMESLARTTSSSLVVVVETAGVKTITSPEYKEILNPFETGINPFNSLLNHSTLVTNDDSHGENSIDYSLNPTRTDVVFSYNSNKEDITQTTNPIISFAPYSFQEENNQEEEEGKQQQETKEKNANTDNNITFVPNAGMCTLEVEYQGDIGTSNIH
ncbi:uncharacterized protein TM35_000012710 [Trypanosoma theileri]|uniref:Uncharacterized protein n=1 Tax=Trypanosoma theileri TaxID=67003 RepID=A0A1X0P8Y4_9TRYP|nr:uncharacterized protein TM35_000012710 [Trypanosoma theileri]ORC93394.1 hypothetical protein TM35_000012710 [Trypanosoma theileri]